MPDKFFPLIILIWYSYVSKSLNIDIQNWSSLSVSRFSIRAYKDIWVIFSIFDRDSSEILRVAEIIQSMKLSSLDENEY